MLKCPFSVLRAIQKVNSVRTGWHNFPGFEMNVVPILTIFEEIKKKTRMRHTCECSELKCTQQDSFPTYHDEYKLVTALMEIHTGLRQL